MKCVAKRTLPLVMAAGLGLGATASWGAESLQDVMKRRNLSQQDLLAAAKTYVPTGKRDEFVVFSSGGQSGQIIGYGTAVQFGARGRLCFGSAAQRAGREPADQQQQETECSDAILIYFVSARHCGGHFCVF